MAAATVVSRDDLPWRHPLRAMRVFNAVRLTSTATVTWCEPPPTMKPLIGLTSP
jgi:hypothetical protein